jgi:hypothetical protein
MMSATIASEAGLKRGLKIPFRTSRDIRLGRDPTRPKPSITRPEAKRLTAIIILRPQRSAREPPTTWLKKLMGEVRVKSKPMLVIETPIF